MLNNGFSLNNFFGGTTQNTNNATRQNTASLATAGQIALYENLCTRKNIAIDPMCKSWTISEMSAEIERINKIQKVVLATSNQVAKIVELSERLSMPEPKNLATMTVEVASKLIGQLIELDKKSTSAKVSQQQLDFLNDMTICPDIPMWELAEVPVEMIDELHARRKMMIVAINDNLKETARQLEDEVIQLQNAIENYEQNLDYSKLSKSIVSSFIEKYKGVFYAWKNSRLSPEQVKFIRELQERLGDEILTDLQLIQFSKKEADEYIRQLQKELSEKEVVYHEATIDDSVARSVKDAVKANNRTQEQITNLIHKLYASIGQEADEEIVEKSCNEEGIVELVQFVSMFIDADSIKQMTDKIYTDDEVDTMLGLA